MTATSQEITVIIPTVNEQGTIKNTIDKVRSLAGTAPQIIVVDGGSEDNTVEVARSLGVEVVHSPVKGRAHQMNLGAKHAKNNLLYFLHADTTPPALYDALIKDSVRKGYKAGCFRLSFDRKHWFLNGLSFFTRFKTLWFRYGDQSLYLFKNDFVNLNGFDESKIIMEDLDIVRRIRKKKPFHIMEDSVTTSARRFNDNGVFRLFAFYLKIFILERMGISQKRLIQIYRAKVYKGKI